MATYPVKLLIDKNGTAFIPVVNSDSIITPDGDTLDDLLDEKQDTLVSGTNLKTINNQSLLGSGNIDVSGGSGTPTDVRINNTSITSSGVANIVTEGTYNSSSNKIATMNDVFSHQNSEGTITAGRTIYVGNNGFSDIFAEDSNTHQSSSVTAFEDGIIMLQATNDIVFNCDNPFTINGLDTPTNNDDAANKSYVDTQVATKQATLVSGTNIKTINNESILGSGNISISGGSATDVQVNGTSITSSGVANLLTNSAYNSSSNKIATMSDIPEKQTFKISDILALSSTDTIWNDFLDCVENKKEFNVESGTVTTGRKTYEIIGTYFKKSSALLKIYYIDEDNIINEISVSYAMPSSKIVTQTTFTPLSTSKVKTTTSTTSGDVYDVTYINTMLGDIESLLGGI